MISLLTSEAFTNGLHLFRHHANPVERVSSLGFPIGTAIAAVLAPKATVQQDRHNSWPAKRGYDLILVARSEAPLKALTANLASARDYRDNHRLMEIVHPEALS